MRRALLVLCCVAASGATLVNPAAAGSPAYQPPVDARVVDPFRPPATRYGPGNRGLEYATEPGATVRAVADGVVTFGGLVAGTSHVTVGHADGVRTTSSFLATIEVVVGQRVRQGDRLGTTVAHLHLGARRGDAYFDPASLFAAHPPRVRLVPFDEPPGTGAAGERHAIGELISGLGGLAGGVASRAGEVGTWLRAGRVEALATLAHYADRFSLPMAAVDAAATGWGVWQRARRHG